MEDGTVWRGNAYSQVVTVQGRAGAQAHGIRAFPDFVPKGVLGKEVLLEFKEWEAAVG